MPNKSVSNLWLKIECLGNPAGNVNRDTLGRVLFGDF